MPKLSQLIPTVTDTVEVGEESITVTFDKRPDTPEFVMSIADLPLGDFWAEFLSRVIIEWDIWDEDGKPWPTDADSLRRLNGDLLHIVGKFIRNHDLGKGNSLNGSHPTASTDGVQPGTPALSPVGTPEGI